VQSGLFICKLSADLDASSLIGGACKEPLQYGYIGLAFVFFAVISILGGATSRRFS
jgi:hypothetical protein